MNSKIILKNARRALFLLAALLLTTASSYALNLAAVEAEWTPPGSTTPIIMWSFIEDPLSCPGAPVAWSPGPDQIEVAGGSLSIQLRNCLSENVSLVIPGQPTLLSPETLLDRGRAKAFTFEVLPNSTDTYTWDNLKPGTYLYQSGSHPAKQVQMGLYGALKVGSYAEAISETTLLFSEIDPALHVAVTGTGPTPLTYKPKYFLINGQSFSPGQAPPVLNAGKATETLLIRFLNAGFHPHTPILQGPYMKIVAEDGNPYPYPRERYSALLSAGKTLDALWTPEKDGTYAIHDRNLYLTSNGAPGGGMLVHLNADLAPSSSFPWILFTPATTGMGIPGPL